MMDMTREAMSFIKDLVEKAAPVHDARVICGKTYTNEQLYRMDEPPRAEPLQVETLTGLLEYVTGCRHEHKSKQMIIHVSGPTEIDFFSTLDNERKREYLCHASANVHSFHFDQWMGQEDFILRLQSNFAPTEDRDLLLKLAGNVMAQNNVAYADDGITQTATMKTGVSSAANVQVPNPVTLAPYRTFQEVDQPETQYIFRMKIANDSPYFLLSDASNGVWKNEAIANIKNYITMEMAKSENLQNIALIG